VERNMKDEAPFFEEVINDDLLEEEAERTIRG
jgi:hypothetical protein